VQVDEIGAIAYAVEVEKRYSRAFLAALQQEDIRRRRFSIAVDYAHGATVEVLEPLLELLVVDVVGLNSRPEPQMLATSPEEWDRSLMMLGKLTATMGLDLGAKLDVSGEKLYLVDEQGQRVPDIVAGVAMAELLWRRHPHATIAVQVDCPSTFEQLAVSHKGRVLRTKVDTHALMVAAEEKDILLALDCNGVFIFSEVHPAPDGMFALSKLLELIAMQNTSLQQVIAGLPKFYWMRATLPCPWDAKGRVMREVNEGVSPYIIDTIDGVRFSAGDARWALIRPDADRLCCMLWRRDIQSRIQQIFCSNRSLGSGKLLQLIEKSLKTVRRFTEAVLFDRFFPFMLNLQSDDEVPSSVTYSCSIFFGLLF